MNSFQAELTPAQVNYYQNMLPYRYSLQLIEIATVETKRQRSIKKLDDMYTADFTLTVNTLQNPTKNSEIKKPASLSKIEELKEQVPQELPVSRKQEPTKIIKNLASNEQLHVQQGGKQLKITVLWQILQKLKSYKSSWPFRLPVNPISQGVPEYLQLIKEPMDLKTMQKYLKTNFYKSNLDFHKDVIRIVENSYVFNPINSIYFQLTKDFQEYYHQLCEEMNEIPEKSKYARSENENTPQKRVKKQIKQQKVIQKAIKIKNESFQTKKEDRLINKLSKSQKAKLIHKIYALQQNEIVKLISLIDQSKTKSSSEWSELQFDLADIDNEKFIQIRKMLKQ